MRDRAKPARTILIALFYQSEAILRLANDPPRTDSSWFSLFITNAELARLFEAITYGPANYALLCAAIYLAGLLVYLARYMTITQQRRVEILGFTGNLIILGKEKPDAAPQETPDPTT